MNGLILGVNYLGKSSSTIEVDYQIDRIAGITINNSRKRRLRRKKIPKVYFEKEGAIKDFKLNERFNSEKDYGV